MDVVLKIMSGSLGLLVPCLFVFALSKGIDRGAFSYQAGDRVPRVLIPLLAPVFAGVIALASKNFRAILDHTPLAALVGVQSFPFADVAFFLVVYLGILPGSFCGWRIR